MWLTLNNEVRFYIVSDETIENVEKLKKMFYLICKENVSINKKKKVLEVYNISQKGFDDLSISIRPLLNDLRVDKLAFVVVPTFNKLFEEILQAKDSKTYYLQDMLLNDLVKAKQISSKLFEKVPDNILETIKNYILMNHSVLRVSKKMFTHRNTINYRVNKFINMTNIDIRELNNSILVYFMIELLNIV